MSSIATTNKNGLDFSVLKGTRLDHPADERFDMAGVYGGGLRLITDDGWSLDRIATPDGWAYVLTPNGASVHFHDPRWAAPARDTTFYLLARDPADMRAFGFSWTGQTIALATSSTLTMWHRPTPLTL